jgi:hypothetical protein
MTHNIKNLKPFKKIIKKMGDLATPMAKIRKEKNIYIYIGFGHCYEGGSAIPKVKTLTIFIFIFNFFFSLWP